MYYTSLSPPFPPFPFSSEAVFAYQKALDLKPNYMRAWTNMGISFANLGEYDK